jgi:hypothetical protein
MFLSQVWWCKFVIQALRRLKQEDHKLREKRRKKREKRKEGRKEGRKAGRPEGRKEGSLFQATP